MRVRSALGCMGIFLCMSLLSSSLSADVIDDCRVMIRQGRFEDARKRLNDYRRERPDDPAAIFLLARIEDDMNRAIALYKEVELLSLRTITAEPDSVLAVKAMLERAEILLQTGEVEEAGEIADEVIEDFTGIVHAGRALYVRGRVYMRQKKYNEAVDRFTGYLEWEPSGAYRAHAAASIAECHFAMMRWEETVEACNAALTERDDRSALTPRLLQLMSDALSELGDDEKAREYRNRLLETYPDSYQAYVIRREGSELAATAGLGEGRYVPGAIDSDAPSEPYVRNDDSRPAAAVTGGTEAGTFSVQAGAFRDRANALRMFTRLKNAGFDSRVEMMTVGPTHLFKVLVGRFDSEGEAERMASEISGRIGEKANVVVSE